MQSLMGNQQRAGACVAGSSSFQHVVERGKSGTLTLRLSGEIDQNVHLVKLAEGLSGHVEIDVFEVRRINSVGVGEWIKFMRALQDTCSVTLVRCSRAIVSQLNTIANFKGQARWVGMCAVLLRTVR